MSNIQIKSNGQAKYIVGLDTVDCENESISVIYPDDQIDYVKIGILDNGIASIKK